ncbi:MAG: methionyl-tRNA formyltransferase [bacterium]|nr:methionyl-tRNA formyltransferase [bacterium]
MTPAKPSIIFFGTPKISAYTLKTLIENDFIIQAAVTKPDTVSGRNRSVSHPPVKVLAVKNHLTIFQPERLKNEEFRSKIENLNPDFFVVVAFGKILPQNLLSIPKFAALNIHFSLLPKYRGASPVATAILNGEKETGVSIMDVAKELDSGDIYKSQNYIIHPDETTCEVEEKLVHIGTELLIEVLLHFKQYQVNKTKQDTAHVTKANLINKCEGLINWEEDADLIYRKIKAYNPWPGSFTYYNEKLVKILNVEFIEKTFEEYPPGTIIGIVPKFGFIINCGTNALLIKQIQPENKKSMTAVDFINGYRLKIGDRFSCLGR